ncbi:RES family NAD+ phosphorylase [Epilithonimonas tenax]|uniref:RES family NAD+ phosphorylase n=1 Tax=Epilithonimonas tenax TaxID=191577 RepID=UPI0004029AFB|nr:RES domain-containing protein [Epilithonimonas tenax]
MLVYRIVHQRYAESLFASGLEGRWNSEGKKVLYTAESISLAYLETLAHRKGLGFNKDFKIMVIKIPDHTEFQAVESRDLSKNWRDFRNYSDCQKMGDAWFDADEKLCLKVPSAVVPENCNVVINTFHKDFKKVKLIDVFDFEPDDRLEQIIKQNK